MFIAAAVLATNEKNVYCGVVVTMHVGLSATILLRKRRVAGAERTRKRAVWARRIADIRRRTPAGGWGVGGRGYGDLFAIRLSIFFFLQTERIGSGDFFFLLHARNTEI